MRSATRIWHPLLQAANVSTPAGTRTRFHVDSQGLRGRERSPDELKDRIVVAVFGGSMTEDGNLSDGQTWPEQLEGQLAELAATDRFAVLNHGMGANSTVEHVIRTAFYQDAYGVTPHCAVYYVGGQDLNSSHFRNLDPGYADYHTPLLIDVLDARHSDRPPVATSPTLRLLRRGAPLLFDTVPPAADPKGTANPSPIRRWRRSSRGASAASPPSTASAACARSGSAKCSTRRRHRPTSALIRCGRPTST